MKLPMPGQSVNLLIDGPVGAIEAVLASPRVPARESGVALVCHPHPLMGGAMSNKVAYTLASSALKAGLHALRFNFRGVGKSEGAHDQGRGETDDTVFLAQRLLELLPGARLLLAGFSFGSFVSLQASARVKPALQVSIAPPFGKYFGDAPPPPRPDCPWLVVHGLDDDVVSYAETKAVLDSYSPPPQLVSPDGVGHFFHGRLDEVQNAVLAFLAANGFPQV